MPLLSCLKLSLFLIFSYTSSLSFLELLLLLFFLLLLQAIKCFLYTLRRKELSSTIIRLALFKRQSLVLLSTPPLINKTLSKALILLPI
jgi:hypothetical protein